ncbi:MAG: hypothetical protein JWQ79_1185 [Mucilaginibacter sp.]|jgi:hypothetical protein|nr:hypothetical protein [Mucilaginibacter sp.]
MFPGGFDSNFPGNTINTHLDNFIRLLNTAFLY